MRLNILYLLVLLSFSSCGKRNLAYFSNIGEQGRYKEDIVNFKEPRIQPDDLLSINISSLSPEGNALFNKTVFTTASTRSSDVASANINDGYLVDRDGFIEFPVLGKINLGGMTKREAQEMLNRRLQEYLKEPTVNIRYLNFRITVLGEVKNPSTFTIQSEKINVLEALGMAGDMTSFGRRERVLLIRERGGVRSIDRIDLSKKEILNSPDFYLQQNDVIYVEPNGAKVAQSTIDTRFISIFLAATSTVSLILWRLL
ncbi:polysaccharide biosynthesis/export family protein [Pontibacter pamirensis]|uniref:polysaccharide biosynthesis/export family protein n=1 Tax=Pontibacter pamirensis TaxID=2562824 RepID=UPI0013895857|nr:polysaccharide biosynthesis/export family protein [Pontibacter pamirensis]